MVIGSQIPNAAFLVSGNPQRWTVLGVHSRRPQIRKCCSLACGCAGPAIRRLPRMELPAVAAIMQGTLFRMPGAVSEVKPTDVPAGLLGMHTMRAEAERETRALRERIRRTRGAIDEGHRPSFEEV